ncbi:hypothetical protein L1D32_11950 [Shewanella insulae]|uniref:DUF3742 family protein n=1 Tax=Shewanella insulae TaxID=2681496 RepID=A0A6L7HYU9_9GAMM|nr:hypothetical protein [Shewanella insulae]MCG9712583.1 hypothetical protein [Shewanella insulae]MCG9738874.1 hypothetical protein [Shewanella insulae]MXR69519.1 hypothetical protein [Shewanella insulae]
MIYHQFQQTPFQHRFSGTKGWMAFAIGLVVMTLVLLALPFVILVGALSFIILSLFGRVFLKRQLAKFRQQGNAAFGGQTQGFDHKGFSSRPFETASPFGKTQAPRQGRTFEHDPNE